MNEKIQNIRKDIEKIIRSNPGESFLAGISLIAFLTAIIGRSYEVKREQLAYDQSDNPKLIYEMCGEDLTGCEVSTINICTDVVYARDFSFCAEELSLPIYEPIK